MNNNKPYVRVVITECDMEYKRVLEILNAIPRKKVISTVSTVGKTVIIRAKLKEEDVLLIKLKTKVEVRKIRR